MAQLKFEPAVTDPETAPGRPPSFVAGSAVAKPGHAKKNITHATAAEIKLRYPRKRLRARGP
jgi:hypothetical protein